MTRSAPLYIHGGLMLWLDQSGPEPLAMWSGGSGLTDADVRDAAHQRLLLAERDAALLKAWLRAHRKPAA